MANSTPVREEESGFRVRYIFYIALLLLALLAIFSYSPADSAAISGGVDAPPANWIGNAGAWFGFWLFNLFGLATYLLALVTLLRLLRAVLPGKGRPLLFFTGEAMILLGSILLLALSPYPFVSMTEQLGIGRSGVPELALAGGAVGQVLAAPGLESPELPEGVLRQLIGAVGTTIFGWALVLGGTIIIYFSDWHALLRDRVFVARPGEEGYPEESVPRSRRAALAAEEDEEEDDDDGPEPSPASGGLFSGMRDALSALRARPRAAEAEEGEADEDDEPVEATQPDLIAAPEPEPEPEAPLRASAVAAAERPDWKKNIPPAAADARPPAAPERGIPAVSTKVVERGEKATASGREYVLPPLSMLSRGSDSVGEAPEAIARSREILQRTLDSFKVSGKVSGYISGPRITRYEISLDEGVNVEKVEAIADNIAMNLSAKTVRVLAPIPGRPVVGVEVPNTKTEAVFMRAVMESEAWQKGHAAIPIVLGKDVAGNPVMLDLAKAPHLLIAGSTGSGKSVCMNTLIMSLLFKFPPDELRLIMVDPKIVEFEDYKKLPHLITPVINDSKKVPIALRWAVTEMEKRYHILAKAGVKKLAEYNSRRDPEPVYDENGVAAPEKMPVLIVIIDELAELMMTDARKDSEAYITRIAQLGRAAGVHIVVATQRPSTQIITGVIKANLPTRIAFRVGQMVDSRVILDQNGAEKLLGSGDMLFLAPGGMDLERVQGAWVKDEDIKQVVKFVSDQVPQSFNAQVVAEEEAMEEEIDDNAVDYDEDDYTDIAPVIKKYMRPGDDDNVRRALEVVVLDRKASTSYLQRRLKIGYNRAAEIMDLFEERGIVGAASGSGNKREILIFDGMDEE